MHYVYLLSNKRFKVHFNFEKKNVLVLIDIIPYPMFISFPMTLQDGAMSTIFLIKYCGADFIFVIAIILKHIIIRTGIFGISDAHW